MQRLIKEAGNLGPALVKPMYSAGTTKTQVTQVDKVDKNPLDEDERELLHQHEATIKKGLQTFHDVGMAFADIRDRGLYREHGTFDEYCQEVWKISRSKAYRYMAASKCVEQLKSCQVATGEKLAIPQNEAQGRAIASLPTDKQLEISRKVAKKTSEPKAKDFVEAAAEVEDEKPRVRSYTAELEAEDDPSSPEATEPEDDDGLKSLAQLSKLATQTYDDYNSGLDQKVCAGLRALKSELKKWADAIPAKKQEAV